MQLPFADDSTAPIPVLLDTDIGSNVDDLLALLYCLGSDKLNLVGVTTVYGDTDLRARVAAATLALAGRSDIPVGAGIGTPLSGKEIFWPGHEGDGYDLSEAGESVQPASSVYTNALDEYGCDLIIAAIGPLTNVVTELQASSAKPQCVIAMAGSFNEGERDRNVSSDTVAAAQLMDLGVPVVFVGIELCRQVPYDPTDLAAIVNAGPDHSLTHVVADRTQAWWDHRGENFSNPCDPLTLLVLAHPELFRFQQAEISFVSDGETAGKTVGESSADSPSWFATDVDIPRARQLITERIIAGIASAPDRA